MVHRVLAGVIMEDACATLAASVICLRILRHETV